MISEKQNKKGQEKHICVQNPPWWGLVILRMRINECKVRKLERKSVQGWRKKEQMGVKSQTKQGGKYRDRTDRRTNLPLTNSLSMPSLFSVSALLFFWFCSSKCYFKILKQHKKKSNKFHSNLMRNKALPVTLLLSPQAPDPREHPRGCASKWTIW